MDLPQGTVGGTLDYLMDGESMEESGVWFWWEDAEGGLHDIECSDVGVTGSAGYNSTELAQIPYACPDSPTDWTWDQTVAFDTGGQRAVRLHLLVAMAASVGDFFRVFRVGFADVELAALIDCDDGVTCTLDACDPVAGCQNILDDGFCAAGQFCTTDPAANPDADGCADKPVLASCLEIHTVLPSAPSSIYSIDPDGVGGVDPFDVYCDMDTGTGGWTEISLDLAYNVLGGTMTAFDSAGTAGIDASFRPFTLDGADDHTYVYDFAVPFGFSEFFLVGYQARANAASGNTSEISPPNFVQSVWSTAIGNCYGDIGFGSADNAGPTVSYASLGYTGECQNCTISWPGGSNVYDVGLLSQTFRMGWGEACGQLEGWYPWWAGTIRVR